MSLPDGVRLDAPKTHADERGWLAEIFRSEWHGTRPPCQWNVSVTEANVLRGMHVHLNHCDYLTAVKGRASVGLFDLRPQSRTYRQSVLVVLSGGDLATIVIPSGVLHGFYHHDTTMHVYGLDYYYDPGEDLYCRWNDPALGMAWPCTDPVLIERDRNAGSLAELEAELRRLNAAFD